VTARETTLEALATLLEDVFDRVYVYPTDYAAMASKPELPFVVVEEVPGSRDGHKLSGVGFDKWTAAVYVITSWGELLPTSAADAAGKALAIAARDALVDLVRDNHTLTNTAVIGHDGPHEFESMITPMAWNAQPAYGAALILPLITGI
jgi:hypothetical protein